MWKSIISTSSLASSAARHSNPTSRISAIAVPSTVHRPFTAASNLRKEKEERDDFHDREALTPERTEVSKSGTDNEIAEHPSAFDPGNTAPESELEATGKEQQEKGEGRNPLNMSPANQDISAWRNQAEGGPVRNADREASSSRGSTKKARSIHVKEDGTHVSYR